MFHAKGPVVELTSLHIYSAWEFRKKRVQVAQLTAYCNYLVKKKLVFDYKVESITAKTVATTYKDPI